MRSVKISPGEYYHVVNRGVLKQNIFADQSDFARFLFSVLYLQSPEAFSRISRSVKHYVQHSVFDIGAQKAAEVAAGRFVELAAFCLMPNHFHLILKEHAEGGIARYMQRVLNGYTKYFNTKYEKSGHLFQGPYRAVHVGSNEQLLYLSAYVHRNPRDLAGWAGREALYPYSSYQDVAQENRWGSLLAPHIFSEQFETKAAYADFVTTSTAKLASFETLDPVQHRVLDS